MVREQGLGEAHGPTTGKDLGTVTVFAGVIAVAALGARLTGVNMAAQRLGPTLFNRLHDLQVAGGDASDKLLAIGRAVLTENLGQFDHGRSAIT